MKRLTSVLVLATVIVCLFGLCAGRAGAETTWYVDDDAPADFATIQAAIDAASHGDTIIVRDGTYTGAGNRDIDFGGKAVYLMSENGPENCVVDAQGSESDRHRVFVFTNGEGMASPSPVDMLMVFPSGAEAEAQSTALGHHPPSSATE